MSNENFLTSCEALKDERFDLEQLMKDEDDNFELNDVMKKLHEKLIAKMVMSMWNIDELTVMNCSIY